MYAMPKGISSAPSSPEPKQPAATMLPRNASSLDGAQIRDSDAFTAEFGPGFTPFPAGGVGVPAGRAPTPTPPPSPPPPPPGDAGGAGSARKRPLDREEPRDFGDATTATLRAPAASSERPCADLQQPAARAHLPDPVEPAVPHTLPGAVSDTLTFQQAWFMLASDTYAGMGVRPHNIPPPFAPRYHGAIFKEFDSDRGMRRKRKARRGSNEQADTWQFKGGPVRS